MAFEDSWGWGRGDKAEGVQVHSHGPGYLPHNHLRPNHSTHTVLVQGAWHHPRHPVELVAFASDE